MQKAGHGAFDNLKMQPMRRGSPTREALRRHFVGLGFSKNLA